jgi:hypothetical protein
MTTHERKPSPARAGGLLADSHPADAETLVLAGKLVRSEQLLDQLFDPDAKPSIRWLRAQTRAKTIPYVRIGHLVFFDVDMVRAVLADKNLVRHRIKAPSVSPSVRS